jgi:hypothetical protein
VITSQDPYLQAAEGFLFTVRDEIDQLDLRLDDSLKIAEVFALVSIARALSSLAHNQAVAGKDGDSGAGSGAIAGAVARAASARARA